MKTSTLVTILVALLCMMFLLIGVVSSKLVTTTSTTTHPTTITTTTRFTTTMTIRSTTTTVSTTKRPTTTTTARPNTTTTTTRLTTTTTTRPAPDEDLVFELGVVCEENLLMNIYDIKIFLDGDYIDTIENGGEATYNLTVTPGNHTIRFEKEDNSSVYGEYDILIEDDYSLSLEIQGFYDEVGIWFMISMPQSSEDYQGANYLDVEQHFKNLGFKYVELEKYSTTDTSYNEGEVFAVQVYDYPYKSFNEGDKFAYTSSVLIKYYTIESSTSSASLYYSTNDYETACKGNTGVFAYKNGTNYETYWIIDFDAGYVYNFTNGNGENTCDKIKISSGTLNDRVKIVWHIDGEQYVWYLHFNYVNSPAKLIVNDHYDFAYEFTPTNLTSARNIMKTKTIVSRDGSTDNNGSDTNDNNNSDNNGSDVLTRDEWIALAKRIAEDDNLSKYESTNKLLNYGCNTDEAEDYIDATNVNWNVLAKKRVESAAGTSTLSPYNAINLLAECGFLDDEIEYALEYADVDWNTEALEYIDFIEMDGEYAQKSEYVFWLEDAGFAESEIEYALENCDSDWYQKALLCLAQFVEYMCSETPNQSECVQQLCDWGFNDSEIEYALTNYDGLI